MPSISLEFQHTEYVRNQVLYAERINHGIAQSKLSWVDTTQALPQPGICQTHDAASAQPCCPILKMCPSFHLLHNISHLPKLLCNESLLKTTPKSSNREQLSSSTHLLHGEPVPAERPILLIGNNTRQLCGHAGQDEVPPKAQHGTWVKFCGKHLIKASIFNNLGKDVCCFLLTQSSFAPPYPRHAGHLLSTDLAQSQRLYEPR